MNCLPEPLSSFANQPHAPQCTSALSPLLPGVPNLTVGLCTQVSFARAPSDLRTVCATRALFEHVVRSLVLRNPRITLLTGTTATNIRLDVERAAVTGTALCMGRR